MTKNTVENKEKNLSLFQKLKLQELKKSNLPESTLINKVFSFNGDFDPLSIQKKDQIIKSKDLEIPDERISIEIVYEPNVKDSHGQWMSEETIRKAKENFELNQSANKTSNILFHMAETESFQIEKSWIQEEMDAEYSDGGNFKQLVKAGTWLAKVKWNEALWDMKKSGEVGGLSLQAGGLLNKDTGELFNITFDPDQPTE